MHYLFSADYLFNRNERLPDGVLCSHYFQSGPSCKISASNNGRAGRHVIGEAFRFATFAETIWDVKRNPAHAS